jgi:hypothetical protein
MTTRSHVADLCTEVLAELDATQQRLRPVATDDAGPPSFRTLVLDLLRPLRTSISRLADDAGAPSLETESLGLPPPIEREAIAILDSCERALAALRLETGDETLESTALSPSSRESASLQRLRSFNDRLKIVLDLRSLCVLHAPWPCSHANVVPALPRIYWEMMQMSRHRKIQDPRLKCWWPSLRCADCSSPRNPLQMVLRRMMRLSKASNP